MPFSGQPLVSLLDFSIPSRPNFHCSLTPFGTVKPFFFLLPFHSWPSTVSAARGSPQSPQLCEVLFLFSFHYCFHGQVATPLGYVLVSAESLESDSGPEPPFWESLTSWEIDGETVETVSDFIFGGSKITADGDCSHEIKRCLLLGRIIMTNLDSILKSRDITLPTRSG